MGVELACKTLYARRETAQKACDGINKDYPVWVDDTTTVIPLDVE